MTQIASSTMNSKKISPTSIPLELSVKFWLERLKVHSMKEYTNTLLLPGPTTTPPARSIGSHRTVSPTNAMRCYGSDGVEAVARAPSYNRLLTHKEQIGISQMFVQHTQAALSHATNSSVEGKDMRDQLKPSSLRCTNMAKEMQRFIKRHGIKQLGISTATGISQSHLSQHLNHGIGLNASKHAALWNWYNEEKEFFERRGFCKAGLQKHASAGKPKTKATVHADVETKEEIETGAVAETLASLPAAKPDLGKKGRSSHVRTNSLDANFSPSLPGSLPSLKRSKINGDSESIPPLKRSKPR